MLFLCDHFGNDALDMAHDNHNQSGQHAQGAAAAGAPSTFTWNRIIWGTAIVVFAAIALQLVTDSGQTSPDKLSSPSASVEDRLRQQALTNPQDDRAHFMLARKLQAQGKLDEAIESFRNAISIRDNNAGYHNDLAAAYATQKKFDLAIVHFRKALLLEAEDTKTMFNLGTALYSSGDLEGAIEQFRKVITFDPTHARAHNNLAVALKDSGQLQEAYQHRYEAMRLEREQQATCPLERQAGRSRNDVSN